MPTKTRGSDQIIVDALTIEQGKLKKQLDKFKADLDATPWVDIQAVRTAASKLDLKTASGLSELECLAKEEKKHLATFERIQKIDRVKLNSTCLRLELEIQTIGGLISSHSGRIAIRKLCR